MSSIHRSARGKLGLETLEGRLTPAVTVGVNWGDLVVTSDDVGDSVTVWLEARPEGTMYVVKAGGVERAAIRRSDIWGGDIEFHGNGGDDGFRNSTRLATRAYGGFGNDILHGNSYSPDANNDYLDGGLGDDHLYGYGGNDYLDGGFGVDHLFGYDGNDILYAGYDHSRNYLYGEFGNDTLYGGFGEDYLNGGWHNDYLYGSFGIDTMEGDRGNDHLDGEWGDDNLYGGDDHDYLFGGYGNDDLDGGWGNDYLYGGFGSDHLDGGSHNDVLDGGDDNEIDYLTGSSGCDYFQQDWQWISGLLVNIDAALDWNAYGWPDAYYG